MRDVAWMSENPAVATVDSGIVTGVSGGSTRISGTIDGITKTICVYVSARPYDSDPAWDDPQHDEGSLITEKKYMPEETAGIYSRYYEVHVKGDIYTYLYIGNSKDLYRMDATGSAEAQKLFSCKQPIRCVRARGRRLYVFSGRYGGTSYKMTCYDTSSGKKAFERDFEFSSVPGYYFAVDDDENFYFVLNDNDLYSYDKKGNVISSDVQSTAELQNQIGSIIPLSADPFNYSILTVFANTMGHPTASPRTESSPTTD